MKGREGFGVFKTDFEQKRSVNGTCTLVVQMCVPGESSDGFYNGTEIANEPLVKIHKPQKPLYLFYQTRGGPGPDRSRLPAVHSELPLRDNETQEGDGGGVEHTLSAFKNRCASILRK